MVAAWSWIERRASEDIDTLERASRTHTDQLSRLRLLLAEERFKVSSDRRLLRELQGVLDFDAQVADRRFKLGVAKQQLHRPQVLGAPVNQRGLRAPHRVGTVVGRVQAQVVHPAAEDASVLPVPKCGDSWSRLGKR